MPIYVQGICCGLRDEVIEFMREGQLQKYQVRTVSFSDEKAVGEPVTVDIPEKLVEKFRPYQPYRVPIEARAMATKSGVSCRLRVPANAVIEPLPPTNPASK